MVVIATKEDYKRFLKVEENMRRRYTSEEISYIKRLYNERVPYAEIKKRFSAEFGRETNGAQICKYGRGKRYKKYTQVVPPSHSTQQPSFCGYCGSKLRR